MELFSFCLGAVVFTPPAMLYFSYTNNRQMFEFIGWFGSMNGGVVTYFLFFN